MYGKHSTSKGIAFKMLEIQDDEYPLKVISSDVQGDDTKHF